MIKNPLRKNTKTMLPDDVGVFDCLSWGGSARLCRLSKKVKIVYNHLFGPCLGKIQEIKVPYWELILPSDGIGNESREVELKQIGKGNAAIAYQGNDGWVWIVVNHTRNDSAKDVLAEFNCEDEDFCKHIPYIEAIGFIKRRGRIEEDFVYRMPYYRTIRSSDKLAWRQLKELKRIWNESLQVLWSGRFIGNRERKMCDRVADLAENSALLPESLKEAIIRLNQHLTNYGPGWIFEFPSRNIGIDEEDNLVLRDVIFNHIDLRRK